MTHTISINSEYLNALCWDAKRNIGQEVTESKSGTLGSLAFLLNRGGLKEPFLIRCSRGNWSSDPVPVMSSMSIEISTPSGNVVIEVEGR